MRLFILTKETVVVMFRKKEEQEIENLLNIPSPLTLLEQQTSNLAVGTNYPIPLAHLNTIVEELGTFLIYPNIHSLQEEGYIGEEETQSLNALDCSIHPMYADRLTDILNNKELEVREEFFSFALHFRLVSHTSPNMSQTIYGKLEEVCGQFANEITNNECRHLYIKSTNSFNYDWHRTYLDYDIDELHDLNKNRHAYVELRQTVEVDQSEYTYDVDEPQDSNDEYNIVSVEPKILDTENLGDFLKYLLDSEVKNLPYRQVPNGLKKLQGKTKQFHVNKPLTENIVEGEAFRTPQQQGERLYDKPRNQQEYSRYKAGASATTTQLQALRQQEELEKKLIYLVVEGKDIFDLVEQLYPLLPDPTLYASAMEIQEIRQKESGNYLVVLSEAKKLKTGERDYFEQKQDNIRNRALSIVELFKNLGFPITILKHVEYERLTITTKLITEDVTEITKFL